MTARRATLVAFLLATAIGCSDSGSGSSSGSGASGGTSGGSGGGGNGGTGGTSGSGGLGGGGGKTDCSATPCRYVRSGATSGGDGSSWSAAFGDLPKQPERGAVYLFADGDYASLMLDAPEAGTTPITLQKATSEDHGTDAGWDPSLGDGHAQFPDITLVSDFWVIDGKRRDETAWQKVEAYGFRTEGVMAHTINFGRASNDVSIRFVDVGGPPNGTFDTSLPKEGFYFGGFDAVIARWTISSCHVHDVYLPFQLAGASEITVERSRLGPNWSKETIRGQNHASRIVVRWNVFKDGCQGTPGDPTAPGCTAQIAMWDGDQAGDFDGSEIYGNVIWTTQSTGHSDGCILVGGDDGVSAAGVAANDVRVYNNTFVGMAAGNCSIRMPGQHTGVSAKNNLWFGLGSGVATGCEADSCENNQKLGSDPFVAAASGDFHLSQATAAGSVLGAPYDVDLDGVKRGGDGVWDLGAYEKGP